MWPVWDKGEVHTEVWWVDLAKKRQLGRLRRRWEDNIKWICKRYGEAWI
jgi:hypothetical protein